LASPENCGVLGHSVEGCAFQIRYLLTHEFARLGMNGREHVRENFLITGDARRWLLLLRTLCGQQPA
jgi:trehalose synthase